MALTKTFVKKNFNLVTDYLSSAPAVEISRCITAVPIKEFKEYLLENPKSSSALSASDTETLLKAIEAYNSPPPKTRTPDYTAYPGAVAYRDGVFLNYEWHAAIICDGPIDGEIFAQATNYFNGVEFATLDRFLDGKNSQGIRVWGDITTSEVTDVINLASAMAFEGVSYTVFSLMHANIIGLTDSDWIEPNRVTDFRCDGFVEYVYEYNSLKLQGKPNVWNIATYMGYDSHNPIEFTPKSQSSVPFFVRVD